MDLEPLFLSLKLAFISTLILLAAGLPFAYWLSRKKTIFRMLLEAFLTMPLVLPPSVIGFYLLIAMSPVHQPGKWLLDHFNLQLVFSFPGLVLGSLIYSLPFLISPVKGAFQAIPKSIFQASSALGKKPVETFFYVLIPTIRPAIISASLLTFAHTLGEFGIVLMIGGNIPGKTRLASIAIYDSVESSDYSNANRYALILFLLSFILILAVFLFNRFSEKRLMYD